MRKVVTIGLSGLVVCSFAGAGYSSLTPGTAEFSQQYTHLIETNQSQTSESLSQTLSLELPDTGSVSVKNFPKLANVTFITGGDKVNFSTPEFLDTSADDCKRFGYTLTSCNTGYWKSNFCPYKNEYFKQCCADKYKYTADHCSYPNELSSDSCGGKYRCICNRTLYPVESCAAPQVVSNDSCTEDGKKYYSECICPSNYTETCTGQNQQGRGTGCTYNGTTKYTACECKPGYNQTCTELGPVTPSDYCLMNNIKYYNNCKTCANKCKLDSCPNGVVCTLEDCSGKYCDIGCATGYVNWCTKPETDCAKLGYTKSVSQCAGDYLQCPYNSAAVFCEDAMETNDETETEACQLGTVLVGDGNCYDPDAVPTGVVPIGIVFDTANRLAVALTDISRGGAAGDIPMWWSSGYCDIPSLENCSDSNSLMSCGADGQANTIAILASACGGTTYAANSTMPMSRVGAARTSVKPDNGFCRV